MDRRLKRIRMELINCISGLPAVPANRPVRLLKTAGPRYIGGDLVEIRRLGAAINAVV